MNAMKHTASGTARHSDAACVRIVVNGVVQGIGFRPFVYRLARELGLSGYVANSLHGVAMTIEGTPCAVRLFQERLNEEKPPLSRIDRIDVVELAPPGLSGFAIQPSEPGGESSTFVMPDIAVCAECLREMRDPVNRRYRYPFINCTHCGPRFSIMHGLPYDRPNTSMNRFRMCAPCRDEYVDPANRRFHAQPIACPACGPLISVWGPTGDVYADGHDALLMTAAEIRAGRIVALKGLGGFQLLSDARNAHAVARLRERKHREEKPFALMYPDLEMAMADCDVSSLERALLVSPESPIVLLTRKAARRRIAENVAPGVATLGAMLPYTPLHRLLLDELGFPIVATSGNLSDEPMCIDERDALKRLGGIADFFLVHDRPIVRQMDDSIVRVIGGRETVLRRARGYAPLPIDCGIDGPPVFSAGAHLKNTVAISKRCHIFLSQHIGDLETVPAHDAYLRESGALQDLFDSKPVHVACDSHPGYTSSKYAHAMGLPVTEVQHHYAHVLACIAEHKLDGPVLGVSWDGTGMGTDGVIWGGEFLNADRNGFARIAHLREFRLPGGEQAVREPRRAALAVLSESYDAIDAVGSSPTMSAFSNTERSTLLTMIKNGVNSPATTSAGRLFDAVASLIGVCHRSSYEGQAAIALEGLATRAKDDAATYAFDIVDGGGSLVLNWAPVVRAIVSDVRRGVTAEDIAARFHGALSRAILGVARRVQRLDVVLTGGCFQNAVLAEQTICLLEADGFRPHWHRFVPPNDGGIAVGQALFAIHRAHVVSKGGVVECV